MKRATAWGFVLAAWVLISRRWPTVSTIPAGEPTVRSLPSRLSFVVAGSVLAVLVLAGASWLLWPGSRPTTSERVPTVPPEEPELTEGDLRFPEKEVDFGLIKDVVRREVEFENRGERVIHIREVKTSCKCTASQPDRTTFQPGEKGRLTVTIDPRGEWIVQRTAVVIVEYEDTSRHEARLRVHVRYRPDLELPERVTIRSVAGQPASAEVLITDNREQPLRITEVTTSAPDLHAAVERAPTATGAEYFLKTSYPGGNRAPGRYAESITVHTTDRAHDPISVPATLEIVKRIQVAPETLPLKPDPKDSSRYAGKVSVEDADGGTVEIESVTPSDKALRCRIDPGPSARRLVEVSVSKERLVALRPPLTIRVLVTRPVAEEIQVPVEVVRPVSGP
jgi:hypothetical protein